MVYGLIALLALFGTWSHNLVYASLGFFGSNMRFWQDTLANPASRSITIDLLFLVLPIFIWMIFEARRLRMRAVWLYLTFGIVVAISVTVPLFMIHRERALASHHPNTDAGALHTIDVIGLVGVAAVCLAYTAFSLLPK